MGIAPKAPSIIPGDDVNELVPSIPPKSRGSVLTRRGDHLKHARQALEDWRHNIYLSRYTPSPFTIEAILPDTVLTTLASNMRIQSTVEMVSLLESRWMLTEWHGNEVLNVLRQVDVDFKLVKEKQKAEKKMTKRMASESQGTAPQAAHFDVLIGSSHFNVFRLDLSQVRSTSCHDVLALHLTPYIEHLFSRSALAQPLCHYLVSHYIDPLSMDFRELNLTDNNMSSRFCPH